MGVRFEFVCIEFRGEGAWFYFDNPQTEITWAVLLSSMFRNGAPHHLAGARRCPPPPPPGR
eukprot:7651003-Lingulodinium_polyedra.AAC.1